jgi:cell division protein FtsN
MPDFRHRDRPTARRSPAPRRAGAGGTLVGIFIGLVLGLGLAAGVAFFVTGGLKSYRLQLAGRETHDAREPAKVAKNDADKPRFDFYKILPGNEEPKVQPERKAAEKAPDRAMAERAAQQGMGKAAEPPHAAEPPADKAADKSDRTAKADLPKAAPGDRFWLQAGSFASEPEAENLKARLALAGWEATVQQGILPDKSIRFRVRLGPYDNTDELGRMKTELGRRGFDVVVMKY